MKKKHAPFYFRKGTNSACYKKTYKINADCLKNPVPTGLQLFHQRLRW